MNEEKQIKFDQLNSKGTILLQYEDDPKSRPKSFSIRAGQSEVLLNYQEASALLRSLKRVL